MSIRVLIVDDSATVRFKLKGLLEKQEIEVEQAGNVSEALGKMDAGSIDVVVTDLRMPGIDGSKLVKSVAGSDLYGSVPVVVLTSSEERDDRLHTTEVGAVAYFNKAGLDEELFVATIRRFAAQKVRTRGFEQGSRVDQLTGLANRRHGVERLTEELEKLERYGHVFAVALLDIDHFKQINDTLGHLAGDDVLRRLAGELRSVSRASDLVIRWGGEEFLFAFPATTVAQAAAIVERFREHLASAPILLENGGQSVAVTVSGGVTEAEKGDTLASLVQRADKGLYRAKETGRNRLLLWKSGELVPVAAA
jgi:diguanylate cyclase (GGDEF)-like protein